MARRNISLVSRATRAARRALAAVTTAFTRAGLERTLRIVGGPGRRTVKLDDVRRRLELLVTAVYDRPIPITAAERNAKRSWSAWTAALRPSHLGRGAPLATTDGEKIQLPREIQAADAAEALARYRLMAIEQAARIARGTTALVPSTAGAVERDLYLLREAAVIDASIARVVPGLARPLAAMRADALAARPPIASLTPLERAVERLLRGSLSSDLTARGMPHARIADAGSTPEDSLVWAREQAAMLAAEGGRYRGIAPVSAWGAVELRAADAAAPPRQHDDVKLTLRGGMSGLGHSAHGSSPGGKQSERGSEQGTTTDPKRGTPMPHEAGTRRLESRGGAGGATDSSGSAEEDRGRRDHPADVATDDADESSTLAVASEARHSPASNGASPRSSRRPGRIPAPKVVVDGIEYPEWDWETGDYRSAGAVIRLRDPDVSDDRWGAEVLARHGALVRRLRERFERLRARRARLHQQRDGDELDLAACVRALVDQRSGHTVDDRLYVAARPARRGLAIALLIDISGSTDEWIDARRRVIDVEKVALLLASEALDALGDLYAILTFSGKGRANVRIRTIKGFDEANGPAVRRRIAALEPEGYTRAGAAIRHAAALLEQQPAAHRLLLIISDGKPNDVDGYEGLSGVEDTRLAIIEARRQGVYPFCLTIDRQGQEYLARIFGEAGHTILRTPQQLPMALVKVVKHLLAS